MTALSRGPSDLPPSASAQAPSSQATPQATPIEKLRALTSELQRTVKTDEPGKLSGHEYRQIYEQFSTHEKQITDICTQCFTDPSFCVELDKYCDAVKTLHRLLPEQIHDQDLGALSGDDRTIALAHRINFSIRKQLLEARVMSGKYTIDKPGITGRICTAFQVSSEVIQAELAKKASTHIGVENFLDDAEAVFLDLAGKRLVHGKPFTLEEVHAICEAIPGIIVPREERLVNFVRPHPVVVFETLHKILIAANKFESCDAIEEHVQKYLTTKPPIPSDLKGFFAVPKRVQALIRKQLAEDPIANKTFIDSLKNYETQLAAFERGLRRIPIVRTKTLLEDTGNINPAYFLKVDGTPCWVFKPMEFGCDGLDKHFAAECTTSLLNFHGGFPTPLTIPLNINGLVGSAQFCVQNPLSLAKIEADKMKVDIDSLQRLVIFDLLFANNDRHSGNFLFQQTGDLVRIAGIDHDSCLMFKPVHALKLEYSHFPELRLPLQKGMEELFSREVIARYADIMKANGVCDAQIKWLMTAAEQIELAFRSKIPLIQVIKKLQSTFESSVMGSSTDDFDEIYDE